MTISTTLKDEAWSNESDLPIVLLLIEHSLLTSPIRVANSPTDISSNGETFIGFGFEIHLPSDHSDAPPTSRLTIDNVSQEIGQAIRLINSPADLTISVIRESAPDTVEVEWPGMELRNVTCNASTVSGELLFEDLTREPFPTLTFSPADFPG